MISKWLLLHQFINQGVKRIVITTDLSRFCLQYVAKILESLIAKQLETYLEENGVITEDQAGFIKQHSTKHPFLT
jgi:flagellar motor switch protein FliG